VIKLITIYTALIKLLYECQRPAKRLTSLLSKNVEVDLETI
jgi:hypothetical protein